MNLRAFAIVVGLAVLGLPAHAAPLQSTPAAAFAATATPLLKVKHSKIAPKDCCGIYRYIYAESWYGFERAIAPVRRAELGDQVRLPGGSWVYCEFSCEYTLKRQSLDFWQGQGAGGSGDQSSPGYLSFNFYPDGKMTRRP